MYDEYRLLFITKMTIKFAPTTPIVKQMTKNACIVSPGPMWLINLPAYRGCEQLKFLTSGATSQIPPFKSIAFLKEI